MDKVQNSSFTASVSVLPFCTSKVVMMSLAGRTGIELETAAFR